MSKFQILWNYTRKKNGEIVIAEEELQKMLDMAEKTAYNEGFMDGLKSIQTPVCHPAPEYDVCNDKMSFFGH